MYALVWSAHHGDDVCFHAWAHVNVVRMLRAFTRSTVGLSSVNDVFLKTNQSLGH